MNFSDNFIDEKIDCLENGVKLPVFQVEKRHKTRLFLDEKCNNYQFLLNLCLEGLNNKIGLKNTKYKSYYERAKYELDIFDELGLCDYLLITWDIINYCNENDIATGLGRGSAAGCLVLYLIGVTKIDSLIHNCYFERFLNRSRCKFKEINGTKYFDGNLIFDVDLDIDYYKRDLVVKYVENKYFDKTSKLLTLSTFSTKILVKEVAKCLLEVTEEKACEISDSISKVFGSVQTVNESYEQSFEFKKFCDENKGFLEVCQSLYLLNKNMGVHPSAILISADEIEKIFPLQFTKDKEIVTGYSMDDALNLSIKVDLLGLRCCTHLDLICKMVGIKLSDIDLTDKVIYDNLQDIKVPHGCFQIEATTNLKVCKKLKPRTLNHLAAVVACARPGGLEFVDQFAKFIETGDFQSIHPFFDDVLKDSAGVPIYQESQLRMLNKIGFDLETCEMARRSISKKKASDVEEWKNKIKQKCIENNIDEKISEIVCEVISNSASYSFNFCLSPGTIVETKSGEKQMLEIQCGDKIKCYDIERNKDIFSKVIKIYENKVKLYKVVLEDGRSIICSRHHKILTKYFGMVSLGNIFINDYQIFPNTRILSVERIGVQQTLDFEVEHRNHNFYADKIVVSNSHAISYASICAATVWAKFKYPLQFYVTLLNLTKAEPDTVNQISKIQDELKYFNIDLLPPHILKSEIDFSLENNNIRMGIGNIKGIAEKSIEKLQKFKHPHSTKFEIFKAANECKIPISIISSLIYVGSLDDSLTESRSKTVLEAILWNLLTEKEKICCLRFGVDFSFNLIKLVKDLNVKIDEKGKKLIKDSRLETIRTHFRPYYKIYEHNRKNEELCKYIMEKSLIGFSYSTNLYNIYSKKINDLELISSIKEGSDNEKYRFVGEMVGESRRAKSKKGTPYFKFDIKDHTDQIICWAFKTTYFDSIEEIKENNNRLPKENDICVVYGKKHGDSIFIEKVGIQDIEIIKKVSELKIDKF